MTGLKYKISTAIHHIFHLIWHLISQENWIKIAGQKYYFYLFLHLQRLISENKLGSQCQMRKWFLADGRPLPKHYIKKKRIIFRDVAKIKVNLIYSTIIIYHLYLCYNCFEPCNQSLHTSRIWCTNERPFYSVIIYHGSKYSSKIKLECMKFFYSRNARNIFFWPSGFQFC